VGPPPPGWKSFSEGPYAGAIHEAWTPIYTSEPNLDAVEFPPGFPQEFIDRLAAEAASGGLQDVLFVLFDYDPAAPTTMLASYCTLGDLEDVVTDTDALLAYYRQGGIAAEVAGQLNYNGRTVDIIKLQVSGTGDNYQVFLTTGDCNHALTLTTRPGDVAQLEGLRRFVEHFVVDADALRAIAEGR
jgi:hypothetical protein